MGRARQRKFVDPNAKRACLGRAGFVRTMSPMLNDAQKLGINGREAFDFYRAEANANR